VTRSVVAGRAVSAFGLELSCGFPVPGLADDQPGEPGRPRTTLILANAEALAKGHDEREVLSEQPLPGGSFSISSAPGGDYSLDHTYYGTFQVAGDGSQIACAPNDLPPWLWQRFLIAQPLPLASLLHGYEPLHASAVAVDGRALLLLGTSGAGKSSVALQLTARGATFVADDVTALEVRDGAVAAHPGAPLVSVDTDGLEDLRRAATTWEVLGSLDGEARIAVADPETRALPVGAVFVLTQSADVAAIEIGPVSGPARALLGGTFNAYMRSPARLARQLELSGLLAEAAGVSLVRIPMHADAGATAEAILTRAAS
jgi:hypothetical protein